MEKFVIVGTGLTGLSLGVLLRDKYPGSSIFFYEKENHIGGLMKRQYLHGFGYDLGGHIWHTNNKDVHDFFCRFFELNEYRHHALTLTENGLEIPWPASDKMLESLPEKISNRVNEEINKYIPHKDPSNFEEAVLNEIKSSTLYEMLIKGYTTKMWGRDPKELDLSFAPKRIKWNKTDGFFDDQYQGYPFSESGYDKGLLNMYRYVHGHSCPACLFDSSFVKRNESFLKDATIFYTGRPDIFLFDNDFPSLKYYGLDIKPNIIWGRRRFQEVPTINFQSTSIEALRCTEFNWFNSHINNNGTIIAYDYPTLDSGKGLQCYPDPTTKSKELYSMYKDMIEKEFLNIKLVGRLAEYRYMNMDECIKRAMEVVENV